MNPAQHPLQAILPTTQYFEIDSKQVGARFGVWVSLPLTYSRSDQYYPLIFTPDGNLAAPVLAGGNASLVDESWPTREHILVSVGYCGDDAAQAAHLRNRDLLPPEEPVNPVLVEQIQGSVEQGLLAPETADKMLEQARNGAADKFLAFLVDELYPQIVTQFRAQTAGSGLWGYSYGGLFTLYAAMQRPQVFPRIGAGSAGMMGPQTCIHGLVEQQLAAGIDHAGRQLHITVGDGEINGIPFNQLLAVEYAKLVQSLRGRPIKGLKTSFEVLHGQGHVTGFQPAFVSFLRRCYAQDEGYLAMSRSL